MVVFFTVCAHVTFCYCLSVPSTSSLQEAWGKAQDILSVWVFVLANSAFKGSTLCRRKGVRGDGAVVIAPSKNPTQILFYIHLLLYDGAEHRERIPFENCLRDFSQHSAIEPVKVFL